MRCSILGVITVALLALGCSTLEGRKVDADGEAVGIPYHLSRPTFSIVRKTTKGGRPAAPVFEIVVGREADPDRAFEVGMDSGWFTSDTFDVKVGASGGLESLGFESKDELAPTLAATVELLSTAAGYMALAAGPSVQEVLKKQLSLGADAPEIRAVGKVEEAMKKGEVLEASSVATVTGAIARARRLLKTNLGASLASMDSSPPAEVERFRKEAFEGLDSIMLLDAFAGRMNRASANALRTALQGHRSKVMASLAKAAGNPSDPGLVKEFEENLKTLDEAIGLVVAASDVQTGAALEAKRGVLNGFLGRAIPADAGSQGALAYQRYADELDEVVKEIAAAVPQAMSGGARPEATEVTSRIDRGIHIDRHDKLLHGDALKNAEKLARARVAAGASAAIVTYPLVEANRPQEEEK